MIQPLTTLLSERRIEALRDRADGARDAVTVSIFPGELHVLLGAHEDSRRLQISLAVANGEIFQLESYLRQLHARATNVMMSVADMENMPAVLEEELAMLRDALFGIAAHFQAQGAPIK